MPTLTYRVPTAGGELTVNCWEGSPGSGHLTVVTVHPWASLGGGEHNCVGIARCLAASGLRTLTFELGASSMVWGVLTGHGSEVEQITAVCNWASRQFGGQILILGSSAGAPMAGSALDSAPSAIALATVGYTCGWLSSVAFGSHFSSVIHSNKAKLFILAECDEFTSVSQLYDMTKQMQGVNDIEVVPGIGHFQLESPSYDRRVASIIEGWLRQRRLIN